MFFNPAAIISGPQRWCSAVPKHTPPNKEVAMSDADSTARVEYLPIPGFTGYRVGDDGSVWSCLRRNDQWRKLKPNPAGQYATVGLCDGSGRSQTKCVHLLVLTTFVGPPPPGMVAAHGDGNARNNSLTNLRWDTQKGNIADKKRHGTHLSGSRLSWTRLSESDVREIRTLIGTMPLWRIGEMFGVTRHQVASIRDRKSWAWLE